MSEQICIPLEHGNLYFDTAGRILYEGVDTEGYQYTDEGTISEFQCRELLAHIEGY